jgi:protein-tyrosine phosphatase
MAEAVMRGLVGQVGLGAEFEIDSAAIGAWHAGEPAQPQAVVVAAERGYVVLGVARQVKPGDFDEFDLLVALDRGHLRQLRAMSLDLESRLKVRLLLDDEDVPDPYGGPAAEFRDVLALIERGCRGLLAELTAAPF